MKRSSERILVTHVGSLARLQDLMEMLVARNEGKPYDSAALARRTREAVADVVQKQIECGVEIKNRPGLSDRFRQSFGYSEKIH